MIRKLRVQGYKCLRDVTVDFEPLTVLIGKNDTGKTSLLEAIHHLGRLAAGAGDMFQGPWSVDRLAWGVATPRRLAWTAEVAASPRNGFERLAKYHLTIDHAEGQRGYRVRDETLTGPTASTRIAWVSKDPVAVALEEGNTKETSGDPWITALATASYLPSIARVARSLSSSVKYSLDAGLLSKPSLLSREGRLGHDGSGLPSVLDYVLGKHREYFDEIERELREAVPFIRSILLTAANLPTGHGKALSFRLQDGVEVAAPLASDGVLLFLAYLTMIHAPESPHTILLEEPENGVHPRQLERIVGFLKRITDPARGDRAAQVVVATHSPYLLDYVPPESVRVFGRRKNGETLVAKLLDLKGVRERLDGGFRLGELWYNVGEDALLKEILNEGAGGQ